MVSEKQNNREYLVRVDATHFVHSIDGRVVNSTDVPSAATEFPYQEADRICRGLRRRGFPMVVVTGVDGRPITFADLRS